MGEFLIRISERDGGVELAKFALPNFLADESAERVYRRIFPPTQSRQVLKMMLTGANYSFPLSAPNPRSGAGFYAGGLAYAGLDDVASEGGCYTAEMQTSFGYQRKSLSFSASKLSDQGFADSGWKTWTNNHSWTPQAASAWDLPWRDHPNQGTIEQAPPEWGPRWNPAIHQEWGFPWYARHGMLTGRGRVPLGSLSARDARSRLCGGAAMRSWRPALTLLSIFLLLHNLTLTPVNGDVPTRFDWQVERVEQAANTYTVNGFESGDIAFVWQDIPAQFFPLEVWGIYVWWKPPSGATAHPLAANVLLYDGASGQLRYMFGHVALMPGLNFIRTRI